MKPKIVKGDISRLKQERLRRGLSQDKLCELIDINPKTYRKIEKQNLDSISVGTLKKVAEFFDMDIVTLFFL